jgi:hypothetical protein
MVDLPEVYDRWKVKIRMRDKLMGSMPKNPGDIERFAASVAKTDEDAAELAEKVKEEAADPLADIGSSGFKKNGGGLYIEARQIKACYKEGATLIGMTRKDKVKGYVGRQFFQHAFFVEPDVIHLDRDEPDGTERIFGSVMTMQGPRSIVRNVDYLLGLEIEFVVKALKDGNRLKDEHHRQLLALMQDDGIGACRSQGYGKFDVIEYETA